MRVNETRMTNSYTQELKKQEQIDITNKLLDLNRRFSNTREQK